MAHYIANPLHVATPRHGAWRRAPLAEPK